MKKTFCIGLPKTGTTSLGRAHEILGFSKAPYDLKIINLIAQWTKMGKPGALPNELKGYIEKYDVFEDWPYPIIWKELFDCFPESHFILSKRLNAETWLKSLQKHTDRNQNNKSQELRLIFFKQDCPHKNDKHYLQYYRNHNKNVIDYFGNNSNFCELTLGSNMNWRNLCEFHDLPIPKVEFPYLNNSIEKTGIKYKLKEWMKKL